MKQRLLFWIAMLGIATIFTSCATTTKVRTNYLEETKKTIDLVLEEQEAGVNLMPYLPTLVDTLLVVAMKETSQEIAKAQRSQLGRGRVQEVKLVYSRGKQKIPLRKPKKRFEKVMNDMIDFSIKREVDLSNDQEVVMLVEDFISSDPRSLRRLKKSQEKAMRKIYRKLNTVK